MNINILHADHGLGPKHLELVKSVALAADGFFIEVIDLPENCPDLMSALYGPDVGDPPVRDSDVTYEIRNDRKGPSRLIDRPHRPCRKMVVVGVGADGAHDATVFTAYGTQDTKAAPREWWDPSMKPHETASAAEFWSHHALAR